jgi:hypothetical protein
MLTTESIAKEKWCPHARLGDDDGSTYNRRYTDPYMPGPTQCLGSGCMMWRWKTKELGYCGLAGVSNA